MASLGLSAARALGRVWNLRIGLPGALAAIVSIQVWLVAAPTASKPDEPADASESCAALVSQANLRGRGQLVAPLAAATTCDPAVYEGPGTQLYSNRPYHTEGRVDALVGHAFCRGERHGNRVWTLEVSKTTQLFALGTTGHDLGRTGWKRIDSRVRVQAAGAAFDGLYARSFAPGRYVIRQDFSRTAPPVFWAPNDARVVPVSP